MSQLAGRKALVTGASRGIGKAIALAYAQQGAAVALSARNTDLLDQVADEITSAGGTAVVLPADVMDADAVHTMVNQATEELGGLDVLVNNAGGNSFSMPLQGMRFSGWQKTFALNVESTVHACQAAIPALTASGHGSIINISSVAALAGAPMMSHYAAAKRAISSLSASLALELAHTNVRVNALCPGWIDTDLTEFLRASEQTEQGVLSRVPMHRWGKVEEIAGPAVFLASDASSFMTGQELVVDGGLSVMP